MVVRVAVSFLFHILLCNITRVAVCILRSNSMKEKGACDCALWWCNPGSRLRKGAVELRGDVTQRVIPSTEMYC